jgi:hypothetical protein
MLDVSNAHLISTIALLTSNIDLHIKRLYYTAFFFTAQL